MGTKNNDYIPNAAVIKNIKSVRTRAELEELKEVSRMRLQRAFDSFNHSPTVDAFWELEDTALAYQNIRHNTIAEDERTERIDIHR